MKKNLLFFLLLFATTVTFGQSLGSIEPNPVNTVSDGGDDIPGDAHFKNESGVTNEFIWIKRVISKNPDWDVAVCDNQTCYPPNVETAKFPIAADSIGDMIVHVYPNGKEGQGEVEVLVFKEGETDTIRGSYFFCIGLEGDACSLISNTNEVELESSSIKVFPNPAIDYTQIELDVIGSKEISVQLYNVIGRQVATQDYGVLSGPQQLFFDSSELLKGIYLMRINVGSQIITRKLLISKP